MEKLNYGQMVNNFSQLLTFEDSEGRFVCSGVLQYRKLAPHCASFSLDGSVLAVGFENVCFSA